MPKRTLLVVIAAVVALSVAGTVAAQSTLRFSDVPTDHPDFAAINWAAEVGVTNGYGDGTFRPEQPLSFRHATVFLARYYEDILGADVSAGFTRSDMMRVLYEMAGVPDQGTSPPSGDDSGYTNGELPGDSTWEGTATFDGEPASVLCGRGFAEIVLSLTDGEWYWMVWLPPMEGAAPFIDLSWTGPNHGHQEALASHLDFEPHNGLGVGPQSWTDVDAGDVTLTVTPYGLDDPSFYPNDADRPWALLTAGPFPHESHVYAPTKLKQQWAPSVNCDQP